MDIFSEIFSIGNIVTLGIVGMVLFLYRQIDKHSQSMQRIQQYAADLKEELTEFVAEKEGAVKDYSISLDVQQKAAKELMRRLQITDEELAAKAAAVARIDERLNAYDVSLKELIEMSVRVQENLNRIREESAFVEKVNKRVGDSKEKFEALEQGLADVERRFAEENASALESIAQQVVSAVAQQVESLRSAADQAERRVAEGKEAVERSEQIRTERIARDMDFINRSLDEALEQAAVRADNMENAALIKLREQAVDRVRELQAAIEDQLDGHLENARNQLRNLQDLVTDCKENWKTDAAELENQQNIFKDEWKRDLQDFQERLDAQRSGWEMTVESENDNMKRLIGDLKTVSDESREHIASQTSMMEERVSGVKRSVDSSITDLEKKFAARMDEMDRQILEANEERLVSWNRLTMEADAKTRQVLADLESASTEIKTHFTAETDAMELRLKDLEAEIERSISALRNQIVSSGRDIEKNIAEEAKNQFDQWQTRLEARDAAARGLLEEMQTAGNAFQTECSDKIQRFTAEFSGETQEIAEKLKKLNADMDENVQRLQDQLLNTAAETQGRIAEEMSAALDRWRAAQAAADEQSRQLLGDLQAAAGETETYISGEIEQVNGRLDVIQNKIDELMGHIENEISSAEERALSLADTELEKWKEAVQEAEERAKQIISVLETSLEDTQNRVSQEIASAEKQIEGLQNKLDLAASRIEVELVNAVAEAKEQGLISADEELEKWKTAVENQNRIAETLLSGIETAVAEAKQKTGEGMSEVAEQLESLQTKLEETAGRIEAELAQAWDNAQDQAAAVAEQELERWKQAVETEEVKVQNVLAGIELSLTGTKERISNEIAASTDQISALQTELNAAVIQIEDRLRTAVAGAQELAASEAAGELDKWKDAAAERDAAVLLALADLDAALDRAKAQGEERSAEIAGRIGALQASADDLSARIESQIAETAQRAETQIAETAETVKNRAAEAASAELEQWKRRLESEDAKIREELSGLSGFFAEELSKWKETVETEDARLRAQLADLGASLEDTELEITSEIANAQGRIEHLQSKIDETCDTVESAMTGAVQTAEKRAAETAETELAKWKETIETEDARLRAQLADLEASLEASRQKISGEILETSGQFDELKARIAETADRVETLIAERIEGAEKQAALDAEASLEKWKQEVSAEETKVRDLLSRISGETADAAGRFDGIQREIALTAEKIAEAMEHAIKTAEEKAQTLSDRGLERWKETAEEGDRKTRELLAELEQAYAEHTGKFDAVQAEIQETAKKIEEILAQSAASAEEKAQELSDRGLERWKETAEEGDRKARELLAELERVSAETKSQVFDEIASAQGQFEALRRELERIGRDAEAQMTEALRNAEAQAAGLAGAELERWRSAVSAESEKTQSLAADLRTAQAESSGVLAEIEERLKRSGEELERIAAEEHARSLAAWKQSADETTAGIRQALSGAEASCAETERRIAAGLTAEESRLAAVESRVETALALLENEMSRAVEKAKEKALASAGEEDAKLRQRFADLESVFETMKNQLFSEIAEAEARIAETGTRIGETSSRIASELADAVSAAETRAERMAEEELEKWKIQIASLEQRLSESRQSADAASDELKKRLEQRAKEAEQQVFEGFNAELEKLQSAADAETAKAQERLSALDAVSADIEQRMQTLRAHFDGTITTLETRLNDAAETVERKILAETDAKFEEYQTAQADHFKRLETLADDTSGLDAELRRYMADIEQKLKEDISRFEADSAKTREEAVRAFEITLETLKTDMNDAEQELAVLKTHAFQNAADQFRQFEDEFAKDLGKRSEDIGQWLKEWQETQNVKISGFIQDADAKYKEEERTFQEELRIKFGEQKKELLAELAGVKTETDGFEADIRGRIQSADDSLGALQAQLQQSLETSRSSAEALVKAELERYSVTVEENLKRTQTELEERINTIGGNVSARSQEIADALERSRQDLDKRQAEFTAELQGLDASMQDVRKRSDELLAESEERLGAFSSAITSANRDADAHRAETFARISEEVKTLDAAIKDADRRIREFAAQTRLFERTDELKAELERRLEELRGDFDRIDQRRLEAMDLEGQLVKIKRLEDEVNAKMTRFLTEKHRIEQMEGEFSRLLQVSAAVEEKLAEVSDADDTLQQIQIQIRKLNDALSDTEEKYQRIEKKNQALDATSDGIDRNFKSLQESEKMSRHITDEVNGLSAEIGALRAAVTGLAEENARAREIADKLSLLDTSLSTVEERIEAMQKARQWLARAETRLEELNKQILDQVKLTDVSRNTDKVFDDSKGAPAPGVRDTIIRLARQGWKIEEISRAVKRSQGEVELVLEIMPKE
jgi:chromosome segregation ATPase